MPQFITLPKRARDITNQRFGRLIAIGPSHKNLHSNIVWYCICDCGNFSFVSCASLVSQQSRSCGCLQRDLVVKHGAYYHPLYRVWRDMKHRCENKKCNGYRYYGGRGISFCEEWRNSPDKFFSYISQLSNFGDKGRTLDRIDTNGDYTYGNLRWSTDIEQARNKRNNTLLTYAGKTQCLASWSQEVGISQGTLLARLKKGLSIEEAFTLPLQSWRDNLKNQSLRSSKCSE